jgi:quercetin dioxygenase-like cupin family protein
MKVQSSQNVALQNVQMDGANGCKVRWLLSQTDGAPNFAMRQFELEPGGYTPHHNHPYEHEIYILEGQGEVLDGDQPRPLHPGDVVYVAPDDVHQFRNTGTTVMKMLCLIPNSADNRPMAQRPECSSVG